MFFLRSRDLSDPASSPCSQSTFCPDILWKCMQSYYLNIETHSETEKRRQREREGHTVVNKRLISSRLAEQVPGVWLIYFFSPTKFWHWTEISLVVCSIRTLLLVLFRFWRGVFSFLHKLYHTSSKTPKVIKPKSELRDNMIAYGVRYSIIDMREGAVSLPAAMTL